MSKNYLIIQLITILPAAALFFSNIKDAKTIAVFLLFVGFASTFIEWKQKDYRIRDLIDRFF